MMSSRPGSARTLWAAPPPTRLRGLWSRPSLLKTTLAALAVAVVITFLFAGFAFAGDPAGSSTGGAGDVAAATAGSPTAEEIAAELGHVKISLNMFFLIFGGALVFFMQAGFAMVETGFSRSKNAVHVIMTNFVIFAIGCIAYWAVGFAFQFGGAGTFATLGGTQALDGLASVAPAGALIGTKGFFLSGHSYDVAIIAMFFFQLVFMDTTATIPTGAMAERWKFSAFVVYGVFIAAILYPIYGNWVWGGGWLVGAGPQPGHRPRSGRLRRLERGARRRRFRGAGRRPGARSADRQVRQGRQTAGHPGAQHAPGHPGRHRPGVRLDRLQRRLHPGGDRPALHRGHRQHLHRLLPPAAWRPCSWCGRSGASPTRP